MAGVSAPPCATCLIPWLPLQLAPLQPLVLTGESSPSFPPTAIGAALLPPCPLPCSPQVWPPPQVQPPPQVWPPLWLLAALVTAPFGLGFQAPIRLDRRGWRGGLAWLS
ncbi:hypothetical protein FRB95_001458 [Tulasnella sp. JGI-2019a]|nr:hypothetical protein FRB95_001458 [Tulasnella sp. JGI-2019a]